MRTENSKLVSRKKRLKLNVYLFSWSQRFHTFGIGREACPNLVQGVAGAGRGQAHFIADDERMPIKVSHFQGRCHVI